MMIFLSYAHADGKFARRLVDALHTKLPPDINFLLDTDVALPGENLFVGIKV